VLRTPSQYLENVPCSRAPDEGELDICKLTASISRERYDAQPLVGYKLVLVVLIDSKQLNLRELYHYAV
jgi:hypothetical protein